jgi:leucyl aminopeptidase
MKKISLIKRDLMHEEAKKSKHNTTYFFFIQDESEIHVLPEHLSFISSETLTRNLKTKNFNTEHSSSASLSFFEKEGKEITYSFLSIPKTQKNKYLSLSNLFGSALSKAQKEASELIFIFLSKKLEEELGRSEIALHLQKVLILKLYQYNEFFSDKKRIMFTDFNIFLISEAEEKISLMANLEEGCIIGQASNFSRYLSDIPANKLYPKSFINLVQAEIEKHNLKCEMTIFDKEQLTAMGMEGIVSIGKGSARDPHFLVLKHEPETKSPGKTIALIGKGITFDTGGISIKPSENMEDMKADMSGAATVVASFIALNKLKSKHTIYALTPLAENMVDGNSIRPGDIVTFYNGKTAEIKNTDAEGRIVLADALAYASKNIKPDIMIDLATLTGACAVALGPVYAGLMSEDETLTQEIIQKGIETGDRCWRLPLEDAYKPNMHSDFADMANIGTKGYRAGTTMGGMFLREFVDPTISWAHIDIANVATECPFKTYLPSYGATGFGVHLLTSLFK